MANWKSVTSFLGTHWTYTQQNSDSCGPSCVMMMIRKRTNVVISENDAFLAYDSYGNPDNYSNPEGEVIREYDGQVYTEAERLARTIRTLIGKATVHNVNVNNVGKLIKSSLRNGPLIGLVSWRGGGGHFVVIDYGGIKKGRFYATVCDPWDGNVRLVPIGATGPVDYLPDYPATKKLHHKKSSGGLQTGYFNGWVVV